MERNGQHFLVQISALPSRTFSDPKQVMVASLRFIASPSLHGKHQGASDFGDHIGLRVKVQRRFPQTLRPEILVLDRKRSKIEQDGHYSSDKARASFSKDVCRTLVHKYLSTSGNITSGYERNCAILLEIIYSFYVTNHLKNYF